ncbi:MAG: hypothetical protein E7290_13295 [Lachnospiraceae bacterium]|nr:hypothetical protein [Lachnospiraceae bacterium]
MELLQEDWSDIDLSEDDGKETVAEDGKHEVELSFVVAEEVNAEISNDNDDVLYSLNPSLYSC